MTWRPSPPPHDGPRGGSPGIRCSGRGCRTGPRGSPGRSGTACARAAPSPRRRSRACRSRIAVRARPGTPLDRVQLAVDGEALDGRDLGAVGLHGEHETRPHGVAVEQDGARSAHAVLAPEVRAGEPAVLPQGVGEHLAWLDREGTRSPLTVSDTERSATAPARSHAQQLVSPPPRRSAAAARPRRAGRPEVPTRPRRGCRSPPHRPCRRRHRRVRSPRPRLAPASRRRRTGRWLPD